MQKKIIALAVAGLMSGAAFAQSNVTVYGVADLTFDNVKSSGGAVATTEPSHNRVSSNSSLLGFKGVEDLGNGMKAVFQFEGGVSPDSGAAFSWSRDSYVGLAGGFGTVALGQLSGPTRNLGAALDVFAGATGIGANSGIIGKFGSAIQGLTVDANTNPTVTASGRSVGLAGPFDTRFKNTIAYISPSFSGVTLVAAYVANENKTDATGAALNTSGYDLGANYTNGPIMAGLTYNSISVRNQITLLALANDIKAADTRLGGSYDFGVAKVNALYDRVKVSYGSYSETQSTWGLGVGVPVGAGKVVGQYYKARNITGGANPESGAKLYALGYEHSLSKRTILLATYAKLNNDTHAAYVFGVNGNPAVADASYSGFQAGLRHTF